MIGVWIPVQYKGGVICYTLVDRDKFDAVTQHRWGLKPSPRQDGNDYVYRYEKVDGKYKQIYLHHVVYGVVTRLDHKNTDRFDNRLENLRPATTSQNSANKFKPDIIPHDSILYRQSRYKGVYRQLNRWIAQITFQRERRYIGSFEIEEEAAKAYDREAKKCFGEFARLNFEDRDEGD